MITRLLTFVAYVFSFFTLVAAGGLPTSNSSGASSSGGSSSNSYSGGASTSISNPLNTLELKNGLNMVQSLVYGKKYEKAEIKLISSSGLTVILPVRDFVVQVPLVMISYSYTVGTLMDPVKVPDNVDEVLSKLIPLGWPFTGSQLTVATVAPPPIL